MKLFIMVLNLWCLRPESLRSWSE